MTSSDARQRFRTALAPGSLFEGKYRIERHIGSGSFAHVLRARHEVMDRDVALKVLKPEVVEAHPDVAARFVSEVRIISKLRHPNTVTVFDFGTTPDGISYMVMEYVEGRLLEDALEAGAMEPRRVVHITKQILKALDEAHTAGIVHRDLKPSNIMLTDVHGETDFVKVLDFGVAKLVGEPDSKVRSKFERRSTQFVGTPIYMSPEQVLGENVVPGSDLYSLGLIVYEMLTGETPIDAPNVALVAQIHIDDDPIPFKKLNELTPRFQKLILKATARRPEERFGRVADFARQLPQIEGVEHSDEFVGLLGDVRTQPPREDGKPDPDEWRDVFSGKNYVAPPPEEPDEPYRRPSKPLPRPAVTKPEPERPRPRRDLELDVGRVRRDELRRERSSDRPEVSASAVWARSGDAPKDVAWVVAGLASLFVSFVIASTVFVSANGPGRWLVGLLPFAAALVATQFSPTRRIAGGVFGSYVLPASRYMCVVLAILVVFVAFYDAEGAASKLSLHGAWFVANAPEDSVLRKATEALGEALGTLFSFASGSGS